MGCSVSVKGIPLLYSYSVAPVYPEADLSAANKMKHLKMHNVSNMHYGKCRGHASVSSIKIYTETDNNKNSIERIGLLDFIHRLVSQKTNKIEELKI
jgi:hypothetical protein